MKYEKYWNNLNNVKILILVKYLCWYSNFDANKLKLFSKHSISAFLSLVTLLAFISILNRSYLRLLPSFIPRLLYSFKLVWFRIILFLSHILVFSLELLFVSNGLSRTTDRTFSSIFICSYFCSHHCVHYILLHILVFFRLIFYLFLAIFLLPIVQTN